MSGDEGAAERGHAHVVARNALFRTVGEVVAKAASVVFYIAVARELGERTFGDFSFAMAFTTVLFLVSGLGTEELLAREVARDHSRVHRYVSNVVAVKALMCVVMAAVAVVVMTVGDYPSDVRAAVYLVGAGSCLENFGRTWQSVFQAYERMEFISLVLIVQRVLTAVVGVAALMLGGGLIDVSLAYAGSSLVGFLLGLWTMRRFVVVPRWHVDRSAWWPLIRTAIPIGLVSLLFAVLLRVDQTLLSLLSGGDNLENGYYGAAFRLIEATLFITWGFSGAMLPWVARQNREDGRLASGFEIATKALVSLLLPIALAFVLLAEPVIELIYGNEYLPAVPALQWLGATTVLFGLNSFAATTLIARDRPATFTRLVVVALVVNVGLNVLLIPSHGATGAALAAFVSGVVLAGLAYFGAARVVGRLNLVRPFLAPALAGAAMTGCVLLTGRSLLLSLLAGGVGYAGALIAAERVAYPSDFSLFRDIVSHALRARLPLPRRAGRSTAGAS